MSDLFSVLSDKLKEFDALGIVIVNKYPWIVPTIIGRISEEFGIKLFSIATDQYSAEQVKDSLQHVKDFSVNILTDFEHECSLVQDNLFDTIFRFNKLFKLLQESSVREAIVDLTGSDGLVASAAMYSATRTLGSRVYFTLIENIPLYGIPAYPGSPRWLHKLYVYGERRARSVESASINYPKVVEWRGSRGIYIAFSKILNALSSAGYYEYYYEDRRVFSESENTIEVYCHSNSFLENKQKLLVVKELTGPDEDTGKMMYSSWKLLSEILAIDYGGEEKQNIDRVIMQIQRYAGAADLVVRQVANHNSDYSDWIEEKLHRVLLKLANEKQPIALVPDTNLFYQGIHMALLKASIRSGSPWSSIRGVNIYIPKCAETEINGKVAEINADSQGIARLHYVMALLANRALLETKYYYGAEILNAFAQPCEVSVAVETSNLPEHRVLLITADHKAYTAWQTLNVCRGKVVCVYIGHSDRPPEVNNIYGRFYVSIALSTLLYVASVLMPLTIVGSKDSIRLTVKSLRGTTAPLIAINKVKV